MYSEHFEGCCGFRILVGFGWQGYGSNIRNIYAKEEIKRFLKEQMKATGKYHSVLLVALNHRQQKNIGHIFKELGWECVGKELYHPAHQSWLFLWMKHIKKNRPIGKTYQNLV